MSKSSAKGSAKLHVVLDRVDDRVADVARQPAFGMSNAALLAHGEGRDLSRLVVHSGVDQVGSGKDWQWLVLVLLQGLEKLGVERHEEVANKVELPLRKSEVITDRIELRDAFFFRERNDRSQVNHRDTLSNSLEQIGGHLGAAGLLVERLWQHFEKPFQTIVVERHLVPATSSVFVWHAGVRRVVEGDEKFRQLGKCLAKVQPVCILGALSANQLGEFLLEAIERLFDLLLRHILVEILGSLAK
mmetsp:Transcript_28551/g.68057  ORF Transcript_28551/g.68057 Transcript_28551/m.68057 type:complete len:245 (-) Transcript_28551:826-1560(-)